MWSIVLFIPFIFFCILVRLILKQNPDRTIDEQEQKTSTYRHPKKNVEPLSSTLFSSTEEHNCSDFKTDKIWDEYDPYYDFMDDNVWST
jgi:hypothetical protein